MTSLSPLDCATCLKELQEPIYLDCSHLFCKDCISGRSDCPTCGKPIPSDFCFDADPLTSYLIDTSHEAAEVCANCERISQPMFFCETCQQSLCSTCKTETHEARMFARHRMVPLEERARVRGATTCTLHPSQPYVLWCGETKRLVCIDCFKGRTIESGHSFIAIDQAHRAQLEKLEQWAERLQAFQEERREEAAARERLITEINESAKATRNDIWSVCQQVVDTVVGVREKLTRQLEEERRKKEEECRVEIGVCTRAVSSGSYCLLSTHILCSAASFIDFLQLNGELVRRIQTHLSTPAPSPPSSSSSTINTRSELAKALEGVLGLARPMEKGGGGRRKEQSGGYKGRSGSPVSVLSKYQMIVDLAGAFGGLMVQVEGPLREVNGEVARLTRAVQERQRDITMRKLLLRKEEIEGTVMSLESVRDRVRALIDRQKALRPEAQAMWEEELDRVTRQQAIFRRKMDDAASLEEQADRALTVSRMLLPFAEGIEKMTEILDRKRLHPPDPAPMESICIQINTLSPDSRTRVQAIEKEEQLRLAREVRRKEEEDESTKQKTVGGLKHTKRREHRKSHHRLVDDRRERSPGGTDVALLSPFHRHTNSITSEDSEVESVTVGVDLLFESDRERSTRWRHETTGSIATEDDDESTSAVVTEERRSAVFRVNMREKAQVAERQQSALNVASRRHTVLSSLNRAIEDYGGGEGNLKASEVKRAERSRANTGDPLEHDRPLSAPILLPPVSISIDDRRATVSGEERDTVVEHPVSASMTSLLSPGVVPAVPFVPQEVFTRANSTASPECGQKMGAFEMRERMLESLKGRVTRYEDEEEEREGETVRL